MLTDKYSYAVAEVRFVEDVRFADNRGEITASLAGALDTNNWILQGGAGRVVAHNGGPHAQLSKATERAFATSSSVGYIRVGPDSINSFLNRASAVFRAFEKAFPSQLELTRIGVRTLRLLPAEMSFEALIERMKQNLLNPGQAASILAPNASIQDVGYSLNFELGATAIRTRVGPMKREQASQDPSLFRDVYEMLPDLPEVSVFLDLDYIQSDKLPHSIRDVTDRLKDFLESQYATARDLARRIVEDTELVPT